MTEPHVAVLSQVQQFLDRQHGLYIDGRPGPAQSEKRLAIFDPATGQEIASTADANEADVDNAGGPLSRVAGPGDYPQSVNVFCYVLLIWWSSTVRSWRNWKPWSKASQLPFLVLLKWAVR
ncbi:phenylacetaldehyde dehydrogenase [Escherichia coli O111:NM str. 03-3484]|nr:phenylacetaldehyde dehydrogenase [Escherichia coli O111:H8 str. CVM9570]EIL19647.1 phenylacetaldehyde dehydrogenase [Escherichia coli O111:H8 str. CVM9574]EJE64351.1 phenylacetaldehyde dehydrogenase [Escherichia coli O111:H8 str. CVM9602]EJE68481.1 phenylacetaldehyde dehydrogenase [Escherichia coli O111:H8 str. CVM9634]EKT99443.1 phenylacetaldehyde dehydrogenase [Escherichia coli O111:H8 str. CFSAN001632]ETD60826.1 phenylacetaldehyde dehydrogenase [Escherichia coli ATCC BAA-2209]EYU81972.1